MRGVAVDGRHIYWANAFGGTSVGRANLDGSGVDNSFIDGLASPCGVAVGGGYVYWVNSSAATIGRADIEGGNVDNGFVGTSSSPCGVAIRPRSPAPAMSTLGLLIAIAAMLAVGAPSLLRSRRQTPPRA